MEFKDRKIVVTGAARGIGAAVAGRLAGLGATVVLADLRAELVEARANALKEQGFDAYAVTADIADEASVKNLFESARAVGTSTQPVSGLVNNAGIDQEISFADLTLEEFDRILSINLRGTFLCCKQAVPQMLEAGGGGIVNFSSNLAQVGGIAVAAYAASKAGVLGLTKAMAKELVGDGIRVNAICPGPIDTEMARAHSEAWLAAKAAELPLGRFGTPDEIANVVEFLLSERSAIFVGQTLSPNSGEVMNS